MSKEVLAESYDVGLTDWLEQNVSANTDIAHTTRLLQQYAEEHEFPIPDARGTPLSSVFTDLANWFLNRRLVADEGIQEGSFRWFVFHVPPRGKGSFSWSDSKKYANGITLKVCGIGLGGTATIKLSKTVELSDCECCHEIIQHMEVRVRRYAVKNASGGEVEERTVDPVRWLHREPRECKPCCDQPIRELDPFRFDLQKSDAVDARTKFARVSSEREIELSFQRNLSLSLELPGKILDAGFGLKSEGALSCKAKWEFAPGALYVPYVNFRQRGVPPYWGVANGSH